MDRRNFVKTSVLSSIGLETSLLLSNKNVFPEVKIKKGSNGIISLSINQIRQLIIKRKITSFEVVSAFVHRIEEVNPKLNAVINFRPEEALREAKKADEDLAKGRYYGVLHGIPCTIKDSFDTEGIVSTAGILGRKDFLPRNNATVVQRLKDAGAIIMGKTNTPELTMSIITDNLIFGKTLNPYDLARSPGGSSGGAAAIIAAEGSPFDIGTDTAGSIRYPCHCCGITGLKPTSGRVPRTGHIIDFHGISQSLTHVGPLARNVEDLELLLNVISGVDNIDPYVYPVELLDCKKVNLEKLRIAVFSDNRLYKPSEDVLQIFDKLRNNMTQAGLTLKETLPEGITEALNIFDPYAIMGDGLKRILEKNNTSKVSLNWILNLPDPKCSYLSNLVESVDEYRSKMSGFWNNYDVLICPVAADTAPTFENPMEQEVLFSYTTPFNITGWPSLVIRGGTASNGLPIGIQIVAPAWREDICFAVAKFLESNLGAWDNHFNFG